jgi:hypothetical protein
MAMFQVQLAVTEQVELRAVPADAHCETAEHV